MAAKDILTGPHSDDGMKVLILGAYGMLGHRLFRGLSGEFDTYATIRDSHPDVRFSSFLPSNKLIADVKADQLDSVENAIKRLRPDAVINCIGIVKQLGAAKDPVQMITINALLPHQLAAICKKEKARLVHFSTDCVFSGQKGHYTLDDIPDAVDLYGHTKFLGEVSGESCLTIRSSIIGRELGTRNGLVEWFLSQKDGKVQGWRNAIYSGFTTIEMARIVAVALSKHPDLNGILQVASEPISKFELLKLIKEKMRLDIEVEPVDEPRIDRSLDGSLFEQRMGYRAPSWDSMIEELAKEAPEYEGLQRQR